MWEVYSFYKAVIMLTTAPMKKIILAFGFIAHTAYPSFAQAVGKPDPGSFYQAGEPLSKEKINGLFLLGKVWGFLKYFHPQIAAGRSDWDNELVAFLPGYSKTTSKKERSDSLLSWINRQGAVPKKKAGSYDGIKDAKLNPDFSWISSKNFYPELVAKLKFILANRAQGDQYYIKFERDEGLNIPVFQHENSYYKNAYPDAGLRLVSLFRFWNIIEYWYPYKYGLPKSWDETLKEHVPSVLESANAEDYTRDIQKLDAAIQDGHALVVSKTARELLGYYYMPFTISCIRNDFFVSVVTNDSLAAVAGIQRGDIIDAIDGISMKEIIQQKLPFIQASTLAYAKLELARDLNKTTKPTVTLSVKRNRKIIELTVTNFFTKKMTDRFKPVLSFQKDSSFCMLQNKIAYLNMGKLKAKDSLHFTRLIAASDALILDLRQNMIENGEERNPFGIIFSLLGDGPSPNTLSTPQPDFAGVFKLLDSQYTPKIPVVYHYRKNIVILINEAVISVGETMTMAFSRTYNAVLMGSNTSGTDGMNSMVMLPGNITAGFTGTGSYWSNGKNTERVGIAPDIKIYPTIAGYIRDKDELVEKAVDYLSKKINGK